MVALRLVLARVEGLYKVLGRSVCRVETFWSATNSLGQKWQTTVLSPEDFPSLWIMSSAPSTPWLWAGTHHGMHRNFPKVVFLTVTDDGVVSAQLGHSESPGKESQGGGKVRHNPWEGEVGPDTCPHSSWDPGGGDFKQLFMTNCSYSAVTGTLGHHCLIRSLFGFSFDD